MSEHVRERLSAYLDRELAAADAEAVLSHLRGCEACQSHLAALTSLDKAARALPVEAPAGYFDTLPGRVRARLEATSSRPAVARLSRPDFRPSLRRLPAWTWAVAAALLLAVVVPITLHEQQSLAPATRPVVTPAAPAVPPVTLKEPEAYSEGTPAPAPELRRAAPEKLSREVAGRLDSGEPKPAARAPFAAAPPPLAKAAPAPTRGEEVESGAAAKSAPPAPAAERKQRAAPGPGSGPYAQAPAQSQTQLQTPADQTADRAMVESLAEEVTVAETGAGARDKEEAARPFAKSARERDEQGLRAGALANRVPPADEQEYSRLAAPTAQTVDALRARREAWRTFVRLYPKSPRADEARVRLVEAGAAAWRLGGDPRDRERVREDAAAYLDGRDAAQKPRVRAVLENLEGR
jgi:putative zinc finger protein